MNSVLKASLLALVLVGASAPVALSQVNQNGSTEEEQSLRRMYAGFMYHTKKAQPDKAVNYIHSMLMYTKILEQTLGQKGTDVAFYNATGIPDRRKFFLVMEAADADGNMFTSDGPCTYFWQSARDGRACGERAAHPNQRVR